MGLSSDFDFDFLEEPLPTLISVTCDPCCKDFSTRRWYIFEGAEAWRLALRRRIMTKIAKPMAPRNASAIDRTSG